MALHNDISARLRAGAMVVVVQEADELLARESARVAAEPFGAVTFKTIADMSLQDAIEQHRTGEGTLVIADYLSANGQNPVAVRLIREIALNRTRTDGKSSRVILLEIPGTRVPDLLAGDVEIVSARPQTVKDLLIELDDFMNQHADAKVGGNGEGKHAVAQAVAGLGRGEAAFLFSRSYVENAKVLDPAWLNRQKATRIAERLGGSLTFVDTDVPDIGGLDNLKAWLASRRKAFGKEKARSYGLPEAKGVFLVGPPGTGKSLTPKVVAREWGLPLLRFDLGRVKSRWVGASEQNIRAALDAAVGCSPCILWIDEYEKALAGMSGPSGDSGVSQDIGAALLTWQQEHTAPVFVVATANSVEHVTPELLRKGRFDELFFIDLPTAAEREAIARIHVVRRKRDPRKLDPVQIAASTEGFSGAEIEQALLEGMFNAFSQDREVRLQDVLDAARSTTPLSKMMKTRLDALRDWARGRTRLATSSAAAAQEEQAAGRRVRVS